MSLERVVFPQVPCSVQPVKAPQIVETTGVEIVDMIEVLPLGDAPCATPPANLNGSTDRLPLIPFASTLRHIA